MGAGIESLILIEQPQKASSSGASSLPPALCRYKTGRCSNARAVKPNGALLLLCELHRSQQNRTKKRSDRKHRHDRARKRQAERKASGDAPEVNSSSDSSGSSSEYKGTPKHQRRGAAPPMSPSSTKRAGAWPPEDVRLLAYFLL